MRTMQTDGEHLKRSRTFGALNEVLKSISASGALMALSLSVYYFYTLDSKDSNG